MATDRASLRVKPLSALKLLVVFMSSHQAFLKEFSFESFQGKLTSLLSQSSPSDEASLQELNKGLRGPDFGEEPVRREGFGTTASKKRRKSRASFGNIAFMDEKIENIRLAQLNKALKIDNDIANDKMKLLEAQLKEAVEKGNDLQAQVADAKGKLSAALKESQEANQRLSESQIRVSDLDKQGAKLLEEKQNAEKLRAELADLRKELDKKATELQAAKSQMLEQQTTSSKEIEELNKHFSSSLENVKSQLAECSSKLKSAREDLEGQVQARAKSQHEASALKRELESVSREATENANWKSKYSDLLKDFDRLTSVVTNLKEKLSKQSEAMEDSDAQKKKISVLESQASKYRETESSLKEQNNSLAARLSEVEERLKSSERKSSEVDKMVAVRDKLANDNSLLKAQSLEAEAANKKLAVTLNDTFKELRSLKGSLTELKAKVANYFIERGIYNSLEATYTELLNELSKAKTDCARKSSEGQNSYQVLARECASIKSELAQKAVLERDCASIKEQAKQSQLELQAATANNQMLLKESADLKSLSAKLQAQINGMQKSLEEALAMSKNNTSLNEQLGSLKRDLSGLRVQNAELQNLLSQCKETDKLVGSLRKQNEELKANDLKNSSWREQCKELENGYKEAKDKADEALASGNLWKDKYKALDAKCQDAIAKADESSAVKNQLDSLKLSFDKLKSDCNSLNIQLATARDTLASADAKDKETALVVSNLKSQLSELSTQSQRQLDGANKLLSETQLKREQLQKAYDSLIVSSKAASDDFKALKEQREELIRVADSCKNQNQNLNRTIAEAQSRTQDLLLLKDENSRLSTAIVEAQKSLRICTQEKDGASRIDQSSPNGNCTSTVKELSDLKLYVSKLETGYKQCRYSLNSFLYSERRLPSNVGKNNGPYQSTSSPQSQSSSPSFDARQDYKKGSTLVGQAQEAK